MKIADFDSVKTLLESIKFEEYLYKINKFDFKKFQIHLKKILGFKFIYRTGDIKIPALGLSDFKDKRYYIYLSRKIKLSKFDKTKNVIHEYCHLIYECNHNICKDFKVKLVFMLQPIEDNTERIIRNLTNHILLPTQLLIKRIKEKTAYSNLQEFIEDTSKYFNVSEEFFIERLTTEMNYYSEIMNYLRKLVNSK